MPCGIVGHAGLWLTAPATSLIKKDNMVFFWVEIAPHDRATASAGPAMKNYNWAPLGISTLLDINIVAISRIDNLCRKWIDGRI